MIPPKGFVAERYPLRHRLEYSAGLSAENGAMNSTILTLVKNYTDALNKPSTILVNPHHASFETETGAVCAGMSIVDKLKLHLTFNMPRAATGTDALYAIKFSWLPIFFSFPEKLDAADAESTTTVKAILNLTKDATKEDITPTFGTKLSVVGSSDLVHPTSSANFTEVFGTLNLSTDTTMEAVAHDRKLLFKALKYYTNKGALKACIGKIRNVVLTRDRPVKSFFINKFVPRAVRRIVPYSYFGILIHVPIESDADQFYYTTNLTTSGVHVGCKAIITYDEWHPDHNQDMA